MYPPHSEGGYELAWQSNVHWLRNRGHVVRVLACDHRVADPDGPEDRDVHRELRWYWRDYRFPPVGRLERLRIERRNAAVLRRHLDDLRPQLVAWWSMGGMSLALIERVRRSGLPAIGFVGDDWMVYGPLVDAWYRGCRARPRLGAVAGALARLPSRVDLGAAAHWHFGSRHTWDQALAAGWALPSAELTAAGVDTGLFRPQPRADWGWRLLYVGRIDPRKGIDTAIGALAELPEATLEIAGRGDPGHEDELRALAQRLGVSDRIDWRGHVARRRLPGRYADIDAVLFPVGWEEPWGLVPLEAMATGRPVLATGRGGSGEYLRDGENCLIVPRGDPGALAAGVRHLAEDAVLRARLRDRGFETAGRYTEEAFNEALERSIERRLRPSSRDGPHGGP
jgi:glycosyltransferase involved in cell wall biosynthesis